MSASLRPNLGLKGRVYSELRQSKAYDAVTRLTLNHPTKHVYNELNFYVDRVQNNNRHQTFSEVTVHSKNECLEIESDTLDVRKFESLEKEQNLTCQN
jgi:hypothetical protein